MAKSAAASAPGRSMGALAVADSAPTVPMSWNLDDGRHRAAEWAAGSTLDEYVMGAKHAARLITPYTDRVSERGRITGREWDVEGVEPELGDFDLLGELGMVEELKLSRDRGNATSFISGQEAELVAELRGVRLAALDERGARNHTGKSYKEWFWFEP